jgi:hypothetical protein
MPDALPQAELVHACPGRSRLRITSRRGDPVFFASVATGLSTFQGVRKVEVNPLTGSVLIHHDVPLEGIAKAAEEVRLFALAATSTGPSLAVMQALPLDMRMMAALGFGALALLQVGRGQVLPQAATLAWYAATLSGILMNGSGEAPGDGGGDGE